MSNPKVIERERRNFIQFTVNSKRKSVIEEQEIIKKLFVTYAEFIRALYLFLPYFQEWAVGQYEDLTERMKKITFDINQDIHDPVIEIWLKQGHGHVIRHYGDYAEVLVSFEDFIAALYLLFSEKNRMMDLSCCLTLDFIKDFDERWQDVFEQSISGRAVSPVG